MHIIRAITKGNGQSIIYKGAFKQSCVRQRTINQKHSWLSLPGTWPGSFGGWVGRWDGISVGDGSGVGCHCVHGLKGMTFHLDPKNFNNLHALDCSLPPPSLPPALELFNPFILYTISDNEFQKGLQESLNQPVSWWEGLCELCWLLVNTVPHCLADLVLIQAQIVCADWSHPWVFTDLLEGASIGAVNVRTARSFMATSCPGSYSKHCCCSRLWWALVIARISISREPVHAAPWDGVHIFMSKGQSYKRRGGCGLHIYLMTGTAVRTTKLTTGPRKCHCQLAATIDTSLCFFF